jgi:hypothetical protein
LPNQSACWSWPSGSRCRCAWRPPDAGKAPRRTGRRAGRCFTLGETPRIAATRRAIAKSVPARSQARRRRFFAGLPVARVPGDGSAVRCCLRRGRCRPPHGQPHAGGAVCGLARPPVRPRHVVTWPTRPPTRSRRVVTWRTRPPNRSRHVVTWPTRPPIRPRHVVTWPTRPPVRPRHVVTWPTRPPIQPRHVVTWRTRPPIRSRHVVTWLARPPVRPRHVVTWPTRPPTQRRRVVTALARPVVQRRRVSLRWQEDELSSAARRSPWSAPRSDEGKRAWPRRLVALVVAFLISYRKRVGRRRDLRRIHGCASR